MKKTCIFLLILALMLCGCKKTPVAQEATQPPTSTAPTTPTVIPNEPVTGPLDIAQEDMFAAILPATIYTEYNKNGDAIFTQTTQTLQLLMPDPQVADKITINFGEKLDNYLAAAQSIKDAALASSNSSSSTYFYHALYKHTRIDQNVFSISGITVYNSGGMRPDYGCISANYSMVTGDYLTLGSILTHADRANDLCELLIEAVSQVIDEYGIWEDVYEGVIRNRFNGDINNDEAWHFSNEGLCFSFPPTDIAPSSARVVSVTIPYEKLVDIIEGEYFPVERESINGTLQTALMTEENANSYTQISEIVMSENGTMAFLYTDQAIYDVCIEVGRWDYGVFDTTYVALTRSALTPGDAIMLQAELPETESPVRVTYRSGDQTHCYFITLNNGAIVLTPEA